MAAELLNKPYRSWSEVTLALAAVFKRWGTYGVEEIAEALMADLPCNRHITDNPDPHRAVERAINRSHDRILGLPGFPAINFRDFTEKQAAGIVSQRRHRDQGAGHRDTARPVSSIGSSSSTTARYRPSRKEF